MAHDALCDRSQPFCFDAAAPTQIYTLSLHDALPICSLPAEQIEELARHLEHCDRCAETVDQHLARHTLIDRLGTPVAVDRKSTRLNSSHTVISYAGFCLKKKYGAFGPRWRRGGRRQI